MKGLKNFLGDMGIEDKKIEGKIEETIENVDKEEEEGEGELGKRSRPEGSSNRLFVKNLPF